MSKSSNLNSKMTGQSKNSDTLNDIIKKFDTVRNNNYVGGIHSLFKVNGDHTYSNGLFKSLNEDFKSSYPDSNCSFESR